MTSYWLSFRLRDSDGWERTYQQRLSDLHDEIEAASGGGRSWWLETTSFYIFNSEEDIGSLYLRITRAIAEEVDLVVIGMNDFKGGWVIGDLQDRDLLTLMPDIKKL
jgi:hypothetical protein